MLSSLLQMIGLVLKHGRLPAFLLVVLVVTNGALAPLIVWLSQHLIDETVAAVREQASFAAALPWLLALLLVLIAHNTRELMEQVLKIRLTHRLRDSLCPAVAQKLNRLQYWCFEDSEEKDLIERVGSSPESQFTQVFWEVLFVPSYALTLGGFALLLWRAGWWVLPGVALLALPALFLSVRYGGQSYFLARRQTKEMRLAGYLSSLITGRDSIKETRLFGLTGYLSDKWRKVNEKLVAERLDLSMEEQKRAALLDALSVLFVFGSVGGFAASVMSGGMTYGRFVALCGAMTHLVNMMTWFIPYQVRQMKQYVMYWRDYQEFLSLPEVQNAGTRSLDLLPGEVIEFRDVHFTYPNASSEVLKGVSFRLYRGEKLAIVGRNGAGKSTIIKLLLGLYEPNSGQITVDGVDLRAIGEHNRRRLFAAVFQDFHRYGLTARENIGLGKVEKMADDGAIMAAASKGMIDSTLAQLPRGLDTPLGRIYEEGVDLSLGQWQRLAIARAQMTEAEVIILDEPAAALDPISEAELYASFAAIAADKTCILVSHRLGSARMADRILVIDDGRVVEEGSHDELMQRDGLYRRMFAAQAEWYSEESVTGNQLS